MPSNLFKISTAFLIICASPPAIWTINGVSLGACCNILMVFSFSKTSALALIISLTVTSQPKRFATSLSGGSENPANGAKNSTESLKFINFMRIKATLERFYCCRAKIVKFQIFHYFYHHYSGVDF